MTVIEAPAVDAAARAVVDRLLFEYADTIDEGRFEDWEELFLETASYRIVARENYVLGRDLALVYCRDRRFLHDRVLAILHATVYSPMVYRHVFGPTAIDQHEHGGLRVRSNFAVYRTTEDGQSDLFSVGRFLADVVSTEQGMRFTSVTVVYDTSLVQGGLVFPL